MGTIKGTNTFTDSVALVDTDYLAGFMFNSYTVSVPTSYANLDWSYALFWTSASTGGNTGLNFPSAIRISGYLSYAEKINTKRLEVYFSNVLPFFKNSDDETTRYASTLSREVNCVSSLEGKCYFETGNQADAAENEIYAVSKVVIDLSGL